MLLFDSTLRVPLAVAGPGVTSQTVSDPVSLVQLASTLVQLAHLQPPALP